MKKTDKKPAQENSSVGQGYDDQRAELPEEKDVHAHNGQDLNSDSAYPLANENEIQQAKQI